MTAALAWLGRRAPWALAFGIALAFIAPGAARFLRPALPFLVPAILGLALARIELGAALRGLVAPRRLALLAAIVVAMMPLGAALHAGLAALAGLGPGLRAALIYLAAAPPIASAAALCFILGFNARLVLEITLAATLATPLVGSMTVAAFMPGGAILPMDALALRLGAMIAAALALAFAIRRSAGPEAMASNAATMDGMGVIAMVIFVVPIFDGVPALIAAAPLTALGVLALVFAVNLGTTLALRAGLAVFTSEADSGAVGLAFGNRNIAIYLAALPPDPLFTLFAALYQMPMLLTPLILRFVLRPARPG